MSRKEWRKQKKHIRLALIINTAGFTPVLFLGIEESTLLVNLSLALYLIINIFFLIRWKKIKHKIDFQVYLLAAFPCFITAHDMYIKGSQKAYIGFIVAGVLYIFMAFREYSKLKRSEQ